MNNINTTNFRAKFVGKTDIKKLNTLKNEYEKYGVSFLEFDVSNKNDLKAMKNISRYWCDSQYAWDICQTAEVIANKVISPEINKIYILTEQKDNFENLKHDEVLGLVEVEKRQGILGKEYLYIHRLQTNPNLIAKKLPSVKYVGTAILNMLKSFDKVIELSSVRSAVNFYKRNEFTDLKIQNFKFRWTPEN